MLDWGLKLGYSTQNSTVCLVSQTENTSSDKLKAQRGSHSNKQTNKVGYLHYFHYIINSQGFMSHFNHQKHPYFKFYFTDNFQVAFKFKLFN